MSDLCRLIWCGLIGLFRPRCALEAENLVLRHQLNVLRRKAPKRVALGSIDRLLLVGREAVRRLEIVGIALDEIRVASENPVQLTRDHRRIRT
jgi:hypothetical protein